MRALNSHFSSRSHKTGRVEKEPGRKYIIYRCDPRWDIRNSGQGGCGETTTASFLCLTAQCATCLGFSCKHYKKANRKSTRMQYDNLSSDQDLSIIICCVLHGQTMKHYQLNDMHWDGHALSQTLEGTSVT